MPGHGQGVENMAQRTTHEKLSEAGRKGGAASRGGGGT